MSDNNKNKTEESEPQRESEEQPEPNPELEKIKQEREKLAKEKDQFIKENNQLLMRGTGLDESVFEGMNPYQVNKFLKNYHKKHEKQKEESETNSNMPLVPLSAGKSDRGHKLDKYLNIMRDKVDARRSSIELDIPASTALKSVKNKKEAEEIWGAQ